MRSAALLLLTALTASVPASSFQSPPSDSPTARFLSAAPEIVHYRAWRRLEAANARFGQSGWIEAATAFGPNGFEYQIQAEGGSERIRRSVLRAALDGERDLIAEAGASALNAANYVFADDGLSEGLARIRLTPRRRQRALVEGHLFVTPDSADLVELRGRLVKMPSFWVSRVEVVRKYARIDGVRVPVSTESVASVRLAGRSTFSMRYVYESINGHAISR